MKRIVFLVFLVGISTTLLFAQNRGQQGRGRVTLSGTVLDKEDDSPIMQATVQLLSLPDSTMAVGNVTNTNGRFSLSVRPGKYVLKVSYVGYLSYMKEYQLTASKPTVNVGKIALASDAIMLKEAVGGGSSTSNGFGRYLGIQRFGLSYSRRCYVGRVGQEDSGC